MQAARRRHRGVAGAIRIAGAGLLAAVLSLTAGCKRDAPSETILRLWHIYGPGATARERAVLDEAVRRFESAHPGVRVAAQGFANDDYKVKLNIEIAGGSPPDVFFTWGGGPLAEFARAGKVIPLDDASAADRFLPAALDICRAEGRLYAWPLDLSCVPLWYNAEVFDRLRLAPPKTFEELLTVCAALRAEGITPLALGNDKQWPGAFYFIYLAEREGGVKLFLDACARAPGRAFNDPAFVRAGERLQQLVRADAFSAGFNGVSDDQARTQFFEGKAAMYLMGTWLTAKAQERPDFLPKLKCVAFPEAAEGGEARHAVVGGVNCAFAVSSACRRRDLAAALAAELTSVETAEAWAGIGRIPAVQVREAALAGLPAPAREALQLLRASPALQPYYDQYLPPRLAAEHKTTTQELFAGTLTPQEAADRMERRAQGGDAP